ncbi:hypothetical protein P154DRAFT_526345 [Amniculicola lignicola CBS 123094]|uniref:Uncharacterized protein n=1 Tax=Amniculicola lignicola CBS 123094 TaxID=1392246 RepID=A0A6A5W8I5_9PLEO|nr:hypothetical protein P154DRAFT_526345 [Amniculicola lignicola CBS 123094]
MQSHPLAMQCQICHAKTTHSRRHTSPQRPLPQKVPAPFHDSCHILSKYVFDTPFPYPHHVHTLKTLS